MVNSRKSRILIFEKHTGGSNKFYTLIFRHNSPEFWANYGMDSPDGWSSFKLYSDSELPKVVRDRINHDYTQVMDSYIDGELYEKYKEKIKKIKIDPHSSRHIWYHLQKYGTLTKDLMIKANEIYKMTPKKDEGTE